MQKIFTGLVQNGLKRGTALGFPTANIALTDENVSGIYAGRVKVGTLIYGSAVFANQERKILEAYLLNFSGDLYGKEITIELLEKIREVGEFSDDETLKKQIASDVEAIRSFFALRSSL